MLKKFISRNRLLTLSFIAACLAIGIYYASAGAPVAVEKIYTGFLYKYVNSVLSSLIGILPFSLGEMALLGLILFAAAITVIALVDFIRGGIGAMRKKRNPAPALIRPLLIFLRRVATAAFILTALFIFGFALNYNRLPAAAVMGLDVRTRPVAELVKLTEALAAKTNALAAQVPADDNDVSAFQTSRLSYLGMAQDGYYALAEQYPSLGGIYGTPKPVLFSRAMCYAGITGIYSPFTGEGNINMLDPMPDYLFTISHEMAHQRGFAREDEANFVAYLVSEANPDVQFQYAGAFGVLNYALEQLGTYSKADHDRIADTLNNRVRSDMYEAWRFWKQFEGPVQEISQNVNNTYLKINRQYDGVYSYGRVIDLMLALQEKGQI